jgi:O-acetyl-ADP-ribose deacetylase (regulator of RNase III)
MRALEVQQADVTRLEVDAIANAANTQLRHGGGVAAAIARAGGPALRRESTAKVPIGLGEAARLMVGVARAHRPRWAFRAAAAQ